MSLGLRYASASNRDIYHVTKAKRKRMSGPAAHPIVLMAHARERTPEPMTAVMMCAPAVNQLPAVHAYVIHRRFQRTVNRLDEVIRCDHETCTNDVPVLLI